MSMSGTELLRFGAELLWFENELTRSVTVPFYSSYLKKLTLRKKLMADRSWGNKLAIISNRLLLAYLITSSIFCGCNSK